MPTQDMNKEEYAEYIQEIFDSQDNILIINDGVKIIKVNEQFFHFFSEFSNLEEFRKYHRCVCEFFEKIDGYVYDFEDKNWVEYVFENPHKIHKAKIKRGDKVYIFQIKSSKLEKFNQTIISLTDITDVELYKDELEESNKILTEYKKAVDASAIVSKTDINGKITYVNKRFVEISGYDKDELIGKPHRVIRHPDMPKEVFEDLWKTILSKRIWHGTLKNKKKDGGYYVVDATIAPILDKHNDIVEFIAMRTDITELVKSKEAALRAEATKTAFLANMSHEIRTPLNAILGYTRLLNTMNTLPLKAAKYVETIDKSAETLLTIVNDILDISKLESNTIILENIEFNPIRTFEETAELFMAKAKEKSIDYTIEIDSYLPFCVKGDIHKLKQIVSNLISNAIKFTPEDGEVSFTLTMKEKNAKYIKVHISVKDSGIGVSPDEKEKILKPFTQANESINRSYGGTGLGLSISNKMLEFMGSSLNIESKKGEGSDFWFELTLENCEEEYNLKQKFANHSIALYIKKADRKHEILQLQKYLESVSDLHIIDNVKDIISHVYDVILLFDDDIHLIDIDITDAPFIVITDKEPVARAYMKQAYILSLPFNASSLYEKLSKACNIEENKEKIATKDLDLALEGKILLVEDHPVNRDLFAALLEQKGNIECTMATNGEEALNILEKERFDLVFMDINMPVMDGITALGELKKRDFDTPVIALTANAIAGDKERFLKHGFDGYLAKPIADDVLNKILKKYLKDMERLKVTFDIEQVSRELNITKDIYQKIVKNFFNMVCTDVKTIEDGIKFQNFEKIYLASHKIKGSSANLRIEAIASIAGEIERHSLEQNMKYNYYQSLESLKQTIHSFQKELS